jgi:very-short-patch-repair endonuclease
VHPIEILTRLGGVGDLEQLLRATSRRRVRTSVTKGEVVRVGHGRYALPTAHVGLRTAARLAGVASHASAAAVHGWELGTQPTRPAVIVPRNRKVEPHRRHGVDVRWRSLEPNEYDGRVTSHHRTVIDCARDLPVPEALAIADSALRHGDVDLDELLRLARRLPSNGRKEALHIVSHASALPANPFESMLRGISLDVPGLDLQSQVWIEERGFRGRPDLVDRKRRLVVEAESFEFHGKRKALKRDCERYTALVIRGWIVVRFAWEHVMFEPDYVLDCLMALVEGPDRRATLPPTLLYTA